METMTTITVEFDYEKDAAEFRETVEDAAIGDGPFQFDQCGHWEGHGSNERWIPHFRVKR